MDMIEATYRVHTADERTQLEAFLTTYRHLLNEVLDGLTEDEARRRLVPSRTTLLGLVKHVTYVEQVWFVETVTSTPRAELGLSPNAPDSFDLDDSDTIASIQNAHRAAFEASKTTVSELPLDALLTGHPRVSEVTLRWVYLHMIRELAQHCGHAEILRELVLASRSG